MQAAVLCYVSGSCLVVGSNPCLTCVAGHDFCTELRKTVPDAVVPVIMVSAKNDEANIVEGLSHGCNDFVRYCPVYCRLMPPKKMGVSVSECVRVKPVRGNGSYWNAWPPPAPFNPPPQPISAALQLRVRERVCVCASVCVCVCAASPCCFQYIDYHHRKSVLWLSVGPQDRVSV